MLYISDLTAGGAQKQILLLANHLKGEFDVSVVTWQNEKTDFFVVPKGIKRFCLAENTESHQPNLFRILVRITRSRKLIQIIQPEVIISFLHEINFLTFLSTFGHKIKTIGSIREYPGVSKLSIKLRIYLFFSRFLDVVVVQTQDIRNWCKKNTKINEIAIVNNLYDFNSEIRTKSLQLSDPSPPSKDFILAVGTKYYQKGFDLLLESYYQSNVKKNDIQLCIVGIENKSDKVLLRKKIESLNLHNDVVTHDKIYNLNPYFLKSKFFVLSSRFEGIPNVLIEALLLQVPIIAFDCPTGPREVLKNGDCGFLVKDRDINELASVINQAITESEFLRLLKIKALQCKPLSEKQEVDSWKQLIRGL